MTTRRKKSRAVARSGINYVRTLVEKCNCIYHEIDLENDIGNDAHLEFIESEAATGCLIAAQIKSGKSYFRDPEHATIQSDRAHFEYWNSHSLPIAMITYDPDRNIAAWYDITELLMQHPERITNGPYAIQVSLSQRLDEHSFAVFYRHFSRYRDLYKEDSYLGRALRDFANLEDAEACLDGLFSLFAYHRHRLVSWYYMISCFRNFSNHPALRDLIIALCHIPGHPDIYWHKKNIIEHSTRVEAEELMSLHFGREDVIQLLAQIDENGIARGTIGQCIHAIIDVLRSRDSILQEITFDEGVSSEMRYWALVLLLYYKQESKSEAIETLRRYTAAFPLNEHRRLIEILEDNLQLYGGFSLY